MAEDASGTWKCTGGMHSIIPSSAMIKTQRYYLDSVKALEEDMPAMRGQYALAAINSLRQWFLMAALSVNSSEALLEGSRLLGMQRRNAPVFPISVTIHSTQRNMRMLENQILLFTPDRLLGLQLGKPDQKAFAAQLEHTFFDQLMPTGPLTKKPLAQGALDSPRQLLRRRSHSNPVVDGRQQ
ncbi:hypothetical protein Ancab_003824 [Ancistrocladus abbreviatus]